MFQSNDSRCCGAEVADQEEERRKRGECISRHCVYSGTSDTGPSEIGTTSLQRTLVAAPC